MVIRRKSSRVSASDRAAAARLAQLQAFLDDARSFAGVEPETLPGLRVRANEDERIFLCIRGVFLFETNLDLTEPEGVRQPRAPTPISSGASSPGSRPQAPPTSGTDARSKRNPRRASSDSSEPRADPEARTVTQLRTGERGPEVVADE